MDAAQLLPMASEFEFIALCRKLSLLEKDPQLLLPVNFPSGANTERQK